MCFCVCCSGVVAECQQERSQLKNREKAMKALRAKLYSMKLEEETSKRYNQRKIQVGHQPWRCWFLLNLFKNWELNSY